MRNDQLKKMTVVVSVILVGNFAGCDQISPKTGQKKAPPAPAVASSPKTPPTVSQSPENPNAPLPEGMLAQVGDWSITAAEFKERIKSLKEVVPDFDVSKPESKKMILDEMVNQQLLVAEAQQQGLEKKKEIVDAVDEFKKSLLVREISLKLTEGVKATEEESKDFYDKNKASFADPTEYHVREIVLSTQVGAKDLLVGLLQGGDFAETAKTRSKGPTATNGGDLGFIKTFPFPQMETAIFSMEVGDISSVFKGPTGDFYIVKLEEKRGGKEKDFADLKNDIETYLTQSKQQDLILKHVDQLKAKAVVKTNESLLKE